MRPIIWTHLRVVDPDAHAAVVRARARRVLGVAVRPVPAACRRADWIARRTVDAVPADVLVVAAAAVRMRGVGGCCGGGAKRERKSAEDGRQTPHPPDPDRTRPECPGGDRAVPATGLGTASLRRMRERRGPRSPLGRDARGSLSSASLNTRPSMSIRGRTTPSCSASKAAAGRVSPTSPRSSGPVSASSGPPVSDTGCGRRRRR
jgi:hypothetical protein